MGRKLLSRIRYATATSAYPIVDRPSDIFAALMLPTTRAVIWRDRQGRNTLDPREFTVVDDPQFAQRFWKDPTSPRGRLASGPIAYRRDLTLSDVIDASLGAKIVLSYDGLEFYRQRANSLRALFGRVVAGYAPNADISSLRGFQLFTPVGGLGRSPELHIDNTILTLHWQAAQATFKFCDNEALPEKVWASLSKLYQDTMTPEEKAANHQFLIELAESDELVMVESRIGDVMITKGQRGLSLANESVRRSVCVHVSSPSIQMNGQVAYLMTPEHAS